MRWQPRQIATFAGALCYSKYGRFKRFLVVLFVRMAGGDTDTSHDYRIPDWKAVDRFAVDFAEAPTAAQHSEYRTESSPEAITSELA